MVQIPQHTQVTHLPPQDPNLGSSRPAEPDTVLLLHGPSSNLFGGRSTRNHQLART